MKQRKDTTAVMAAQKASAVESIAIYIACVSGLVGFGSALIAFWGRDISLFERGVSVGFMASIISGVIALAVYAVTAYKHAAVVGKDWRARLKQRVSIWSLAIVHGLLAFLMYALLFYIVDRSFIGVLIDQWAASALVAFATGLAGYFAYLSAATMSSMRIAGILALFLVSGTFVSMLTAQDPNWWYLHFSSLGASGGVSGYAFNGTLIIVGAAVVGLVSSITHDFMRLRGENAVASRTKTAVLMMALSGIGIALALVGVFVYDKFPVIHELAAGGMAVFFMAIILALPWLMSDFPRAFFVASYGLLAALLFSTWLYLSVGYFNLTVFEIAAAAVIFTWLVVFVRQTAALLSDRTAA